MAAEHVFDEPWLSSLDVLSWDQISLGVRLSNSLSMQFDGAVPELLGTLGVHLSLLDGGLILISLIMKCLRFVDLHAAVVALS